MYLNKYISALSFCIKQKKCIKGVKYLNGSNLWQKSCHSMQVKRLAQRIIYYTEN